MKLDNPNLPANHQEIDNIPDEDVASVVVENPEVTAEMDKDQLAKSYEALEVRATEIKDAMVEIKKAIFDLMEADSEEAGNYLCFYMNKQSYPDLDIETARDLGLTKTKETIDNSLVKRAVENGVDLGKVEVDRIPVMRLKKAEV